jgi:hypothetical protein
MTFPPALQRLRVTGPHGRGIRLWLPLFLLWPLLPVLLVLGPPIAWLVLRRHHRASLRCALLVVPAIVGAFCALRGLEVRVQSAESNVHVAFY